MQPVSNSYLSSWFQKTVEMGVAVVAGVSIGSYLFQNREKICEIVSRSLNPKRNDLEKDPEEDFQDPFHREIKKVWENSLSPAKLISSPIEISAANQSLYVREIAGKGDCFFLSYGVALLEWVQKNKNFDSMKEALQQEPLCQVGRINEVLIPILEEASNCAGAEDLEVLLQDEAKMSLLSKSLRIVMSLSVLDSPSTEGELFARKVLRYVSKTQDTESLKKAIDVSPWLDDESKEGIQTVLDKVSKSPAEFIKFLSSQKLMDLVSNTLCILKESNSSEMKEFLESPDFLALEEENRSTKANIYADFVGGLNPRQREWNPSFNKDNFLKLQEEIIKTSLWPSDLLIKELFLKLGVGMDICVYSKDQKDVVPYHLKLEEMGIQSAGSVLLFGRHYMNVYPKPPASQVEAQMAESSEINDPLIEKIQTFVPFKRN